VIRHYIFVDSTFKITNMAENNDFIDPDWLIYNDLIHGFCNALDEGNRDSILLSLAKLQMATPQADMPALIDSCMRDVLGHSPEIIYIVADFFGLERYIEVPVRVHYTRTITEETSYSALAKLPLEHISYDSDNDYEMLIDPHITHQLEIGCFADVKVSSNSVDVIHDNTASKAIIFKRGDMKYSYDVYKKRV